ncbi:MAG TPA: hypothetical protein VL172_01205 [Kofleriaceae bacterium]|nr:hypothetical protein [Kofleriaceae bacterium]
MPFLEAHARLLLVVHTALAVGAVAASTHVVVWMRRYPRGDYARHDGVRRLSLYAALLFVGAFVAGNLMYPTYRVRVRAAYLEDGGALMRERELRAQAHARAVDRYDQEHARGGGEPLPAVAEPGPEVPDAGATLPRRGARMARWFDVKEHWLALGLVMAVAVAALARLWDPRRAGAAIAPAAFALAVGAAATAWLGAIVGVLVSSWRAVGPL